MALLEDSIYRYLIIIDTLTSEEHLTDIFRYSKKSCMLKEPTLTIRTHGKFVLEISHNRYFFDKVLMNIKCNLKYLFSGF